MGTLKSVCSSWCGLISRDIYQHAHLRLSVPGQYWRLWFVDLNLKVETEVQKRKRKRKRRVEATWFAVGDIKLEKERSRSKYILQQQHQLKFQWAQIAQDLDMLCKTLLLKLTQKLEVTSAIWVLRNFSLKVKNHVLRKYLCGLWL